MIALWPVLAFAAALATAFATRVWSFDIWWHMATGRWVATNGSVPTTDPFSFTCGGEPWHHIVWLADLYFFEVFSLSGCQGLVVSKVACAFIILGALGLAYRRTATRLGTVLATLFAVATLVQFRFSLARPEALGAVLLAITVALSIHWWNRGGRALWAIPALLLPWVAIHGTAALGVAICGATFTSAALVRRPRSEVLSAFGATALSVAVLVLTKGGRDILATLGGVGSEGLVAQVTREWEGVTLATGLAWMPWLVIAVGAIGCIRRDRKVVLPAILCAAGLILSIKYVRYLAPAVVLASPAFVLGLDRVQDFFVKRELHLLKSMFPWFAAIGLAAGHLSSSDVSAINANWGFACDETQWPADTARTLATLPEGRVLNDLGIGGYLIWNEVEVFIDGRTATVYRDEDIAALLLPAAQGGAELERVADEWDIVYGLAPVQSQVGSAMMRSQEWIPIHHGVSTTLFVRAKHVDLVQETGVVPMPLVRFTFDEGWTEGWYRDLLAAGGEAALTEQINAAFEQSPNGQALAGAIEILVRHHGPVADRVRQAMQAKE